jgi:hypothetical protein
MLPKYFAPVASVVSEEAIEERSNHEAALSCPTVRLRVIRRDMTDGKFKAFGDRSGSDIRVFPLVSTDSDFAIPRWQETAHHDLHLLSPVMVFEK